MGTVFAVEYLSLDGVMEEPGWSGPYFNEEVAKFQYDNLFETQALLLGRVTYEGFKAAWPSMTDEQGFADRMNEIPKYVATSTPGAGEWNATLIAGDVLTEVTRLKQDLAGSIMVAGSGKFFTALHAANLIDEYRFMIFPVVLGTGQRLFTKDSAARAMALVKSQVTTSGVAILTYRPA